MQQAAVKKIGIGIGADTEKVIDSVCRVSVPCDIVCYSRPGIATGTCRSSPHTDGGE